MDIANKLLEYFPQESNYRFIDSAVLLDDGSVISKYRLPKEAEFYKGHFPGNPVTPGSVLLEIAAQSGLVVLGKCLVHSEGKDAHKHHFFLVRSEMRFRSVVKPDELLIITGKLKAYKEELGIIRSFVTVKKEDGSAVCSGVLTCKIMVDD